MLVSTENFTHGENFKFRQHQILALFQHHKAGLTIEELVTRLDISRTAVNQHLVSLERDGLIKKSAQQKSTGLRPGWTYQITDEGINRLPKQGSWYCQLKANWADSLPRPGT